jgi:hypothetical protein
MVSWWEIIETIYGFLKNDEEPEDIDYYSRLFLDNLEFHDHQDGFLDECFVVEKILRSSLTELDKNRKMKRLLLAYKIMYDMGIEIKAV